ncbi:GNAT family N-acetyltransferase [Paenibacillus sp. HJL G12]|uniref:GNAT family N-acetyltransferase n=1 Tax=Paenibacillus dendrobii TaxID=2691084 RepID=A0A7X3IK11_9BACL|nr:GNAT family N-acetyltransferase [Paenibacillus dendrobii]MWV45387.1 GNAT family N-acetyltransferase [Paenibacillus dendrobii]
MIHDITVFHEPPAAEEYVNLRLKAGLSGKDIEASRRGLANSLFAVTLRLHGELIGMGRVIGDGGCMFHVVDIAVSPEHQGKGLGKKIMSEVTAYLDRNAVKGAYVSLMADVPADRLYQQFGFEHSAPASVGMYKKYN